MQLARRYLVQCWMHTCPEACSGARPLAEDWALTWVLAAMRSWSSQAISTILQPSASKNCSCHHHTFPQAVHPEAL
jgi:hypothetical protein